MKILLALDGSTASDRAIELVATTPWPVGSQTQLIHVAEPHVGAYETIPGSAVSADVVESVMEADRERWLELLATAASRLAAPGRTITTEAIEERAGIQIVP